MKYRYRAILSKALQDAFFDNYIDVPSIEDAKDGFWVDGDGNFSRDNEFSRDEDALTFIMPSQILFIQKVDVYD